MFIDLGTDGVGKDFPLRRATHNGGCGLVATGLDSQNSQIGRIVI
jgi:hypothetical protein